MRSRFCFGIFSFCAILAAQDDTAVREYGVAHAECERFGPQSKRFIPNAHQAAVTAMTTLVASHLTPASGGMTPNAQTQALAAGGDIDSYIFAALSDAGVTPAPSTTDYEFIRRVTLDLTGRIPTPARVLS